MCGRFKLSISLAVLALIWSTHAALAEDPVRPDPRLTPGAVLTTDTRVICQRGYTRTVRHTSGKLEYEVYREYGIDPRSGHYEIDHLIPLEVGGADVRENLWPESRDTPIWNANTKDRLENYLHEQVCAGRIRIEQAQREIATDWIATYKNFLGNPSSP